MKRLAILGASGHGKVVADCAELCGWESVSFFDDAWPTKQSNGAWPVIGDTSSLLVSLREFDGVLVAIGNNQVRGAKLQALSAQGATLPTLIHPSAVVSRYAVIGAGSVLFAGAVVNVDCQIGSGAIINTGATVDHDCVLGNAVHVSPGVNLAGGVCVGDRSWVGIGSSVRQLVRIGCDVMVGAGSAVVSDISDACVVTGVPARVR
ncbi:sugar O-acyltransferase, sialic acid O-acetyltransferase NeuD family [Halopseudomonas litoralis]|uniref:Sugar O-acyltransferase, sialic acid O-acetyltransferase NeuD family n=1 Tax=Halopseudomonas litoralis TaxID=797277 RepID=A0A1H1S7J3_9GAMM|nr:acetyltransferase [Halopseudomonas litoralis]SDS43927.1 sugar O-acyltransferase, sialic acid O-acetyltransferase NeuD family [Halopseudomonas litoralis]